MIVLSRPQASSFRMAVPIQSRCSVNLWFLGETCIPGGWTAHLCARQEASDKILELPHWFLRSQRYKHRLIILWKACICSGAPCITVAEKSSSEEVKNRWIFRDRPFWSIPLPGHDFSSNTLILLLCLHPKSFLGLVHAAVPGTVAAAPALEQEALLAQILELGWFLQN